MDFKQLEAYALTVELNSFSKAAETMDISQSSVSLYIRALEKELKTKLIVRTTRDISLTESGENFYEYARDILALKENAVFNIKKENRSYQGNIKILSSSVPSQYILPKLISEFHKKYSNISFSVIQLNSSDVINAVSNSEYEFGVVGSKIENQKCYYKHITSSPLVLITPPDEKIKKSILQDPQKYFYENNFIAREEGSATKSSYEKLLKQLGIKTNEIVPVAKFSNTHSIIQAVSNGLGISIVAQVAVSDYIKTKLIHEIPINEIKNIKTHSPEMSFNFVFKKEGIIHPRTKLFIDFVLNNNSNNN